MRLVLSLAAAALLASSARAQLSIELSGTGSDGRAVLLRADLPEPVTTPKVLRAFQMRCAPHGTAAGLFPDAAAGKRGFIEFRADRPAGIMGLGLRFQPTLSFTSVPIVRVP